MADFVPVMLEGWCHESKTLAAIATPFGHAVQVQNIYTYMYVRTYVCTYVCMYVYVLYIYMYIYPIHIYVGSVYIEPVHI